MKKDAKFTTAPVIPSDLPHLAYVVLWFPLFTQPFIFREVEYLRKILPVEVYALYGKNERFWSKEMCESDIRVTRYGIKAIFNILWATLKVFYKKPGLMRKLFCRFCLRKWNSWEILGENLWAFCCGSSLAERFKEDGIDMVYAPWPRGAATAAIVAASLNDIPYAIAARGDNLMPADPDLEDKFANALLIRANNAADQKRIESFGSGKAKNKTCLVYNSLPDFGASLKDSKEKPVSREVKLLAIGRFDVTKGFDILLKACAILAKKGITFKLTLAGGGGRVMGLGNLEQYLRDLSHELNLDNHVSMPGLISHDELPDLIAEHDIFVAPCVVHSSGRRDGIPNTVIEAMAHGMPVVSTNINAIPEVIKHGETGLLVPQGEPEALADAIARLIAEPEFSRKLGENGKTHAATLFDSRKNAQLLADFLVNAWNKYKILKLNS